jgi:hypothetical protein
MRPKLIVFIAITAILLFISYSIGKAIRAHRAEITPQQLDSLIMHWEASGAPMLIYSPHAFVMYDTITKRGVLVPIAEEREKIMKLLDK